ncbi:site-specific integrase [Nocardia sp. NPDC059764]|uniref:site-specific integrase n=1 Tax=Nocardia sp. NPDC059764 TaxID=3346939 RepID=UPI00364E591E
MAEFPGRTWQQRWDAAHSNAAASTLGAIIFPADAVRRQHLVKAVRFLFGARIVRPTLTQFRAHKFNVYATDFQRMQHDPLLDSYFQEVAARTHVTTLHKNRALFDVCCALTTQGIQLADLTPSAMLYYANETRRLGITHGGSGVAGRLGAHLAWEVLCAMGHFPASTPPNIRAFTFLKQQSVDELVDRYQIENSGIRQLLIRYLNRRAAAFGYRGVDDVSRILGGLFWSTIESLHPGQSDLRIDPDTYRRWREDLNWTTPRKNAPAKERTDTYTILLTIRGFYADLHSWAIEDPILWGRWAAPCPIDASELRNYSKRLRRIRERTDNRIRLRQPILSILVDHIRRRYENTSTLLRLGSEMAIGSELTHNGHPYTRVEAQHDRNLAPAERPVRLQDSKTGKIICYTKAEEYHFRQWVAIEVLRLSGIRIEELCELSQLSIRQYQRHNGEVIALLVIAPSKSDRERVIPMSAELFHVIAQIIKRLTAGQHRSVALIPRWDPYERVWLPPMPFLFQRQIGCARSVVAAGTVVGWLTKSCEELAEYDPRFRGLHFTPHDFRRLLATDMANSGLPIHIGAALLGHLNIQTTRGYISVFDEDIVRHYQAYLEVRRRTRPTEEYRPVTDTEWSDFQEHFDRRKVELGTCARPYGTPCQHEHACIRCPMLNINPDMLGRLDELEADLLQRRLHAQQQEWLGEIEGIDLTLTFLRQNVTKPHA